MIASQPIAARRTSFVYWIGLLVVVTLVFLLFLPKLHNFSRATLPEMVYGTADKPFAYRVLVPFTVRVLTPIFPVGEALIDVPLVRERFIDWRWETAYATEYVVAVVLLYALWMGAAAAIGYMVASVYDHAIGFRNAAMIVTIFFVIPLWIRGYSNYLNDPATLILFPVAIGLMARARWTVYGVVFVLATLNKETSILLTILFCIYLWKTRTTIPFWRVLAAQVLIYGAIRALLTLIFQANGGFVMENHWDDNVARMAALVQSPLSLVLIAGLCVFVFYRWNEKPRVLRRALWLIVPIFVLGMISGVIDEFRIFYEVYPVIMALILHSAARLIQIPLVVRQPEGVIVYADGGLNDSLAASSAPGSRMS